MSTARRVARITDVCSGHSPCFPSRPSVEGSPDVFVNGLKAHRQGDLWAEHCCMGSCHTSVLLTGSQTVFVNGRQLGRIRDPVACGSIVGTASLNVFAGG